MEILVDKFLDIFGYCPCTGKVFYKSNPKYPIGKKDSKGYIVIRHEGHQEQAHRIAFAIFYRLPLPSQIDHKNLDKSDNRIDNLRISTNSENAMNRKINTKNTSGFKGVYWHKEKRKWIAVVRKDGAYLLRKSFDSKYEAADAAKQARDKFHGEYARHN